MKKSETSDLLIEVLKGADVLIKQEIIRRKMGNHMAQNLLDILKAQDEASQKTGFYVWP